MENSMLTLSGNLQSTPTKIFEPKYLFNSFKSPQVHNIVLYTLYSVLFTHPAPLLNHNGIEVKRIDRRNIRATLRIRTNSIVSSVFPQVPLLLHLLHPEDLLQPFWAPAKCRGQYYVGSLNGEKEKFVSFNAKDQFWENWGEGCYEGRKKLSRWERGRQKAEKQDLQEQVLQ